MTESSLDDFGQEPTTTAIKSQDDTSRLEAFSDGVFSVAITLLVLNLQVPHLKDYQGHSTLLQELLNMWPVYFGYVTSFFTIGVVWANHHRTFGYILRADHTLRMINIFLLMTVTLIPFTTALLSEYIQAPDQQRTAAVVYALGWILLSTAYNLLWQYAIRRQFVDPALTPAIVRQLQLRTLFGLFSYVFAMFIGIFNGIISVLICAALAIFYLIT